MFLRLIILVLMLIAWGFAGCSDSGVDDTDLGGPCCDHHESHHPDSGEGECEPQTCEQIGASCGYQDDGCGGALSCGGCVGDETCEQGQCESPECGPSPEYQVVDGECLPSCGAVKNDMGWVGSTCSYSACAGAGLPSWDCNYCCESG